MTPEEFLQAYDAYADALFRHCTFRTSNREEGMDLMQETFLRAWEFVSKGGDVRHMRGFLYHIAHNLIINAAKRRKAISLDELQEGGFDPADASLPDPGKIFDERAIHTTLSKLDPDTRDLLVMRFIDDLPPSEIADILGLSPNVISVRIHRGLKLLRSILPT